MLNLIVSLVLTYTYAAPVTSSVGVIGSRVITSRQVVVSDVIEKLLESAVLSTNANKKQSAKLASVSVLVPELSAPEYRQAVNKIMVETMVVLEADALSLAQVTDAEVEQRAEELSKQLSANSKWKELQVDSQELRSLVRQKLRAKSFLKFKTQSSGVSITDEEAESYFNRNKVRFGGLPFAQFKDQIKSVIAEEQIQLQLEEWFELLRRKYRVRLLSPTDDIQTH